MNIQSNDLPQMITKKDLRNHFGISGRTLRTKVFPDEVLERIGMTPEEYKKHKGYFNPTITQKIYKVLNITKLL